MYSSKRRPRSFLLTSKALMLYVAIPVIWISTLDGVNYREMGAIAAVLAVAMLIAHRADKMHEHIDDLENRLTKL